MSNPEPHRWTWVYCVFDGAGSCLYVGMTVYRDLRWRQHMHTNPQMAAEADRFKVLGPYTRTSAQHVERRELLRLRPRYNRIPKWLESRADEYVRTSA